MPHTTVTLQKKKIIIRILCTISFQKYLKSNVIYSWKCQTYMISSLPTKKKEKKKKEASYNNNLK